jgi:alpha-tubulin suppressor-like RCC1 family protein
LADNGWVYASGSCEKGQLGNGRTGTFLRKQLANLAIDYILSAGERIVSTGKTAHDYDDQPLLIKPFTERKIVMIASGQQHSLALSDDGYLWAWGKLMDFASRSWRTHTAHQVSPDMGVWVWEIRKIGNSTSEAFLKLC